MVGIAFADLGIALLVAARLAKALGPEDQAIVADLELDVAADRLDIERIVRVPRMDVGLVRGGRRGKLVDECQQPARAQVLRVQSERMEHAHQPFAAFGEFGIGHTAGHRHAERDDQPDVAGMEGRMRRARAPDEIVKASGARPGDGLVDPALLVARSEPGADHAADPRRCEVQDLEAGALRQAFGEELTEDLAGPLVGPDQRGDFEHEPFGAGVAVELRPLVIDPVG